MIQFGLHRFVKLFRDGSVFVVGRKGTGKDLLMSNCCCRIGRDYIGNIDYSDKLVRHQFNIKEFCINNDCYDFLNDDVKFYEFPYADGTDIWLSDGGAYFPNFKTLELNKKYEGFIYYIMLSRQISASNVHVNTQAYGRIWDKLREQFHSFILCKKCRLFVNLAPGVIKHIPFLRNICCITLVQYERAEALETEAVEFRVKPPRKRLIRGGFQDETAKQVWESQKMQHDTNYGKVRKYTVLFFNKSSYDTRRFKEILLNGKKNI